MRLNRWVLLLALLVGGIGTGFLINAFSQFLDANRSYTSFDIAYVPDSFTWQDSDFEHAVAEVTITNDADRSVTIEHLQLHLYFDNEFAGSWYEPWEQIVLEPGASVTVIPRFTVTSNSIQPQGGTAELALGGQMRLAYEQIERTLTVPLRGTVGQVGYDGS